MEVDMSSEAVSYFPGALVSSSAQCDSRSTDASMDQPEPLAVPRVISGASDAELLRDIGEGRKEALSVIFRRYARSIRHIGLKILKNQQEAEDLVQEVFLSVYRSAAQFNPTTQKAGSWIVHIAYQRAFDRRRYLNARRFCNEISLDDLNSESFAPLARNEIPDQVLSAIVCRDLLQKYDEHLTDDQHAVIQLFFFEGYSLKEIAPIIGQTAGNVRNHFYRGLDQLRRSILPELSRSK
jgi:RNA polymerase sigma-70 factor, ECF subfamily